MTVEHVMTNPEGEVTKRRIEMGPWGLGFGCKRWGVGTRDRFLSKFSFLVHEIIWASLYFFYKYRLIKTRIIWRELGWGRFWGKPFDFLFSLMPPPTLVSDFLKLRTTFLVGHWFSILREPFKKYSSCLSPTSHCFSLYGCGSRLVTIF